MQMDQTGKSALGREDIRDECVEEGTCSGCISGTVTGGMQGMRGGGGGAEVWEASEGIL